MKRRVTLHLAALAALAALAWAARPAAQAPPPDPLRLVLEIGKTSLVIGEPLYATVRLINVGAAARLVRPGLFPESGAVRLFVGAANGSRATFRPMLETFEVAPPRLLRPGQELSASFPMFFEERGWMTGRAGAFQVQAIYLPRPRAGDNELVTSNRVAISVADGDPAGPLLMAGPEGAQAGKFLTWLGGDHLLLGTARLQEIVVRHPDSVLADYATLALGRSLSREFTNFAIDRVRPPEYARALAYFADVRTARLPPYLRIIHALEQARCLIRTGRSSEGRAWIETARRLIDDQPKWRPFSVQLDALSLEAA
jgi:hypothetical protein